MEKKIITIASLSIAAIFSSCQKNSSTVVNDYLVVNDTSPIDLREVINRYHEAYNRDDEFIDVDELEGIKLLSYGTPRADSLYAVTYLEHLSNLDAQIWSDAYNGSMICNDIWSWFSIWDRADFTGSEVNYDSIKTEILAFDASCIKNPEIETTIKDVQKEFADCLDLLKDGKRPDDDKWPIINLNECVMFIGETLPKFEISEESQKAFYNTYSDWREDLENEVWKKILACEDAGSQVQQFQTAIQNATSFEQQCRFALCGMNSISPDAVLPIARTLLGCGKYTPHLFALWYGWRTIAQIEYWGRSRDSIIADELFNIYRQKAFLTALYYADQHPEDQLAAFSLTPIVGLPNIVRNGDCIFGNDANLDYYYLFGEEE